MPITVVVPVMTLGNCVLLPQQLLPLRIFEPRYRQMLKDALAGNRMFALSQLDESKQGPDEEEPPCPFTCVGRIAGHIECEDGTSHLILEGMRRAKVIKVQRKTPYPCLEIAPVAEESWEDSVNAMREIARVLAYSEKLVTDFGNEAEPLIQRLRGLSNQPGALADAAAGHLIPETEIRRTLLECLSPGKRLKMVADHLSRMDAERIISERDFPSGLN